MLPFLTAYDPIGGSPGSIDPLGSLQTYSALADLLLPGVTTITNRSRYLSMVCAAIANAENHRDISPGPSGLSQRRKAVEPFERLWALACVAAHEAGHEGAADGLRGVTYADKHYRCCKSNSKKVNCDYQLLKSQIRTGAVGTYWTAIVGGLLVNADSGALSADGMELAEHFPELPLESKDRVKFADPASAHCVWLPMEDFLEWSKKCHLKAADRRERKQLGEALTADDRRECVRRAFTIMADQIPDVWDTDALNRLAKTLKTLPKSVELGLPVVIDAIVETEQFHEAVITGFEALLWWGTENAGKALKDLFRSYFSEVTEIIRATAKDLINFQNQCELVDVNNAIRNFVKFAKQIDGCITELELVEALLRRHHEVQSGKANGGIRKSDWISLGDSGLLRPSPRFQRMDPPALANGKLLTHPYRFEQFIYMLRENGLLAKD